jgi:GTPase involved in cell partitioning and DNA repair
LTERDVAVPARLSSQLKTKSRTVTKDLVSSSSEEESSKNASESDSDSDGDFNFEAAVQQESLKKLMMQIMQLNKDKNSAQASTVQKKKDYILSLKKGK